MKPINQIQQTVTDQYYVITRQHPSDSNKVEMFVEFDTEPNRYVTWSDSPASAMKFETRNEAHRYLEWIDAQNLFEYCADVDSILVQTTITTKYEFK